MEEVINILHLEDDANDSLLIQMNLKEENLNFNYFLALNESDFVHQLNTNRIDIILSDYSLPSYSGSEALNLVKEQYQHIPFVFVSGTMGEDVAIDSLVNGAIDYVLKNRLERLGPAVRRAIRESKLRQEYNSAIEKLRLQEEQYRILIEGMNEGIMLTDNDDRIIFVNQQTCEMTGYGADELVGKICVDTLFAENRKSLILEKNKLRLQGIKDRYEVLIKRKDKKQIWVSVSGSPVYDQQNRVIGSIGVFENINEHVVAEEELRKLKRAVDQSPDSIIITDLDGVVEYANPVTTSLTGYSIDEMKGQKISLFKTPQSGSGFFDELLQVVNSGKVWTAEIQNTRKTGESYWESVSISPIHAADGKITHYLAIMEDISERKRMTEELVVSKEKAEESDRLKSAFLANISHEIRTPMNGILGFAELLKIPELSPDMQERYIQIIEQSGNRMLNIINDIVDISKIEAGQMTVNIQQTNITQLVQDLYTFFAPQAESKNLKFVLERQLPEQDSIVSTDQTKLSQILSNLIKNAIKFTNSGSIKFGYYPVKPASDANRKSNAAEYLEFYVRDTGVGILPEQAGMVFERFRQGSFSLSRDYEGAGLGLSISKAFVEILGGSIWLESEYGIGTVFYFRIPRQTFADPEPDPINENADSNNAKPIQVLLVEDDENSLMFMRTIMELEKMHLFEAYDGETAVEMVKENPEIDLVLMDMKIPLLDGYSATRQIKQIRPELPVIAQTAFAFAEDHQKALDAGCAECLAKPIKRKVLIEKIRELYASRPLSTKD